MLSVFAQAALEQFKLQGTVWDGNLVSKTGRTELYEMGLVKRWDGNNALTQQGRQLAMRLLSSDGRRQ